MNRACENIHRQKVISTSSLAYLSTVSAKRIVSSGLSDPMLPYQRSRYVIESALLIYDDDHKDSECVARAKKKLEEGYFSYVQWCCGLHPQ